MNLRINSGIQNKVLETGNGQVVRQVNPHFTLARKIVNNPLFSEAKEKLTTSDAERFFKSVELFNHSLYNWHIFKNYNDELISKDYVERFK
jgi:2'-5' RNA ligase